MLSIPRQEGGVLLSGKPLQSFLHQSAQGDRLGPSGNVDAARSPGDLLERLFLQTGTHGLPLVLEDFTRAYGNRARFLGISNAHRVYRDANLFGRGNA